MCLINWLIEWYVEDEDVDNDKMHKNNSNNLCNVVIVSTSLLLLITTMIRYDNYLMIMIYDIRLRKRNVKTSKNTSDKVSSRIKVLRKICLLILFLFDEKSCCSIAFHFKLLIKINKEIKIRLNKYLSTKETLVAWAIRDLILVLNQTSSCCFR